MAPKRESARRGTGDPKRDPARRGTGQMQILVGLQCRSLPRWAVAPVQNELLCHSNAGSARAGG